MEVVVDGTVESCMDRVDSYFRHEWPHGGSFGEYSDPSGKASVVLTAEKRFLFNSWGGLALIAGLSLITLGAFLVVYFVYLIIYIVLDDIAELIQSTYTAQVIVRPSGAGQAKIQTSASRPDWQQTLDSWVEKDLVENKAAAVDPAEISASEGPTPTGGAASTDIPEQIRKLGELRDAGVLTEEEFEAKKKDLLDRM
jgi:hypothetical protein